MARHPTQTAAAKKAPPGEAGAFRMRSREPWGSQLNPGSPSIFWQATACSRSLQGMASSVSGLPEQICIGLADLIGLALLFLADTRLLSA